MTTAQTVRVAAGQCAIGSDIPANLATCLRVLDKAAEYSPELVVLPEFANHLSWYNGPEHCYETALDLDGEFLAAIAAKAAELKAYVVIGATLRRGEGIVSGSNILFSPTGERLVVADKQVLIGHENDFLRIAESPAEIADTAVGRLGLYMCMDGVINETPRCLALRGAQVLCNSLNSFAPDEGNLHIPVRAAENKVFVVAANKVGPLVPEAMMADISAATNIPERFLNGAGESQIVAPDGTVLAMASLEQEEVVFADIDVRLADNKARPDGSDLFASRRPELYGVLGEDPAGQPLPDFNQRENVAATLVQPGLALQAREDKLAMIEEAASLLRQAFADGAELAAVAPLWTNAQLQAMSADSLEQAAVMTQKMIAAVVACCEADQFAVFSGVLTSDKGAQYSAILLGEEGVLASQPLLHCDGLSWSIPGEQLNTFDTPVGHLALIVGQDSIYPETFRLAALQGADTAVVVFEPQEAWELHTGLVERAAENRLNMLAACHSGELGQAFGAGLLEDFTIFGEWKTRQFDGVLTRPALEQASEGQALRHLKLQPKHAENKVVSANTHVLNNRPWRLLGAML